MTIRRGLNHLVVEQVRKIFLTKDKDASITIEFTYNKRLKQHISDLSKTLEGQLISSTSKQYIIQLTEKNLYLIVSTFKNKGFDIDPQLMNFYQEVSKILNSSELTFDVFNLKNDKLVDALKRDITEISSNNLLLLNDRKIRFQYQIDAKNQDNSLKNLIANRTSTKVWIDSKQQPLEDVVQSIKELNRLPLLLVFNGHDSKECLKNLHDINQALVKNDLSSQVGIYFRFDNNTEDNKNFNAAISSLGFNTHLTSATQVAGIVNNKLPKFLLKTSWYPKSVITFSNAFRNNKTSVYCDAVDLIIHYNEKQPLEGNIDAIV